MTAAFRIRALPPSLVRLSTPCQSIRPLTGVSRAFYSTEKPKPPLLGRYTTVPYELFSINATKKVILRDFAEQKAKGRSSYDLHIHEDGLVHPAKGDFWIGPNGASVHPDGPMLQEVVRNFRGKGTTVYRILPGKKLPDDLVLLHEHSDLHSIQCNTPMTLAQLNKKVTEFCQQNSEEMTQAEFVERYPFTV
ncbi:hypothetical protein BDZ89DRAFT_1074494 [Hymenopellis radicata]|nr:hypothetical protein BDZ89DRAFT_1074494 [Hymenopellis radicata]